MDRVQVGTVVYLPPEEVYAFLLDFPGYAEYSTYLESVRADGDGGPGTAYALRFAWWKLGYTVHSEVTDVDPPRRIDWRVTKDVDANGYWEIEPVELASLDDVPDDADTAVRVTLHVRFRSDTVDSGTLDLPRFVSFDWLVDRVEPKVEREARRVVSRIVADLEGRDRPVDLTVRTSF